MKRFSVIIMGVMGVLIAPMNPLYAEAIRFAVVGDYGYASQPEQDVAALINSWNPNLIITTGDNNYPMGAASTIDQNVGQYYHQYLSPYLGSYGAGASENRFFPSLGNHDWLTSQAQPYLDYFTLPGNERYYDFSYGSVHFFAIDSNANEPDGNTADSVQANWLKTELAAAQEPWKIVYMHHAPYSSGSVHGSTADLQWPYEEWGATAVLAGHEHTYERLDIDGLTYFVNGVGGSSLYGQGAPVEGSQYFYSDDYGAMLVTADDNSIQFDFYNRTGELLDRYSMVPETLPGALIAGVFLGLVVWNGLSKRKTV